VLSGYVRVRAGERLATRFRAATEIFVGLEGEGRIENGAEAIDWRAGDVVLLPGGGETRHAAGAADAVLWAVNDEPYLRFAEAAPPAPEAAPVEATHFRAEDVRRELMKVHDLPEAKELAGYALLLSSARMERRRSIAPLMTLALNSLPGGVTITAWRLQSTRSPSMRE
jgi:gentisate 1,2-dioxygenase